MDSHQHIIEGEAKLATARSKAEASPARVALVAEATAHFTAALARIGLTTASIMHGGGVVGPSAPPLDPEREARLASVTEHVRESTDLGPDFCRPCSEALGDWVPWPCDGSLVDEGPAFDPDACHGCGHPKHPDDECDAVVGYDHLNGDHECGCLGDADEGPDLFADVDDPAVTPVFDPDVVDLDPRQEPKS